METVVRPGAIMERGLDLVKRYPVPLAGPLVALGLVAAALSPSASRPDGLTALVSLAVFVALVIGGSIAWMVSVRASLDALATSRAPDLASAWRGVQPRSWSGVGTLVAWGLAVSVGLVLLVVPGVLLLVALFPIVAVVVAEHASLRDAFARAWSLTTGHRWSILVVALVAVGAFVVAGALAFIPFVGALASGVLGGAISGWLAACIAAFYQARVRPLHANV